MSKILLVTALLVFALVSSAWAVSVSYNGSITSPSSGGMVATDGWNNGNATLSWIVANPDPAVLTNYWTYTYTFTGGGKDVSHVIIEVSDSFTPGNMKDGTTTTGRDGVVPKWYASSGTSQPNPGMPNMNLEPGSGDDGDLFGIKWDCGSVVSGTFNWTVVTDKAPMWGDFYAKDGQNKIDKGPPPVFEDVYAYNTGFGTDAVAAIGDGNAGGWVLVPDTNGIPPIEVIPEPATMLLVGSGLLGLARIARRKK